MNQSYKDIEYMLSYLELDTMADRLEEIISGKERYTQEQLVRELVQAEYNEQKSKCFQKELKNSRLSNSSAEIKKLRSGNGRIYDENIMKQIKRLDFVEQRKNLCIFGQSGIGKTYAAEAIGIECCRKEYRTRFYDFTELLDELVKYKQTDQIKYGKKLKYYSNIQVLIIDDFLITHISEERTSILFQLIKNRTDTEKSTILTCQYPPSAWKNFLGNKSEPALGDAIRRRLTSGYIVQIDAAKVD